MLGLILAAALATSSTSCAYDKAAMLALTAEKFDQDMKGGWRPLAEKPACRLQAAQLLADYRAANWSRLTPSELRINYWHEGQMRAMAGETAKAAPLLLAGVDPSGDDEIDFTDYALGTVAFLKHDKAALLSARARLATLPKPGLVRRPAEGCESGSRLHAGVAGEPRCSGRPDRLRRQAVHGRLRRRLPP